jgi:hypothetical protein
MIPLSGAPLYGRLLALPTNIRQGWKGLPGTNICKLRPLKVLQHWWKKEKKSIFSLTNKITCTCAVKLFTFVKLLLL